MNVVDSSGWLEYFADGPNADFFAPSIEAITELIVPSISLYEVFKVIYQRSGENDALQAIAHMQQGLIVDLDSHLALIAAKVSATAKLPMADSIILATAQAYSAVLWTQDIDLKDFPDVRYINKR